MKLLAVDTSSPACTVALDIAGELIERHVVEPRAHTRVLMPMISEVLAEGGALLNELDAIVLGNGPGSFIGMRIGASVVQGLSFGASIPVVPVSSLMAIAVEAFKDPTVERVLVAQDARMNEVYLGRFRRGEDRLPVPEEPESIVPVGRLPPGGSSYAAAGGAWGHYPELLAANRAVITTQLAIDVPRAIHLLPAARPLVAACQFVAPEQVTPAYLRMKVAEKPGR